MGKLPAFQFYPADWRKDPGVQALSFHDRGVWFEILCLMHESEERGRLILNGRPMPDAALARLLGLDKQTLEAALTALLDYGVASRDDQGALVNRRMMRDEHIRQVRSDAGKRGGNPALLKQEVKQIPTPSSSSSSSSSSSEKNGVPPAAAAAAVERKAEGERLKEKAENPDPWEDRIWKDGIELCSRSGMNDKQIRPFLGRMAKEYGKQRLAEAIAVTQAANPPDPKAYLVAVLQRRAEKAPAIKRDTFAKNEEFKAALPEPCGYCGRVFCLKDHRFDGETVVSSQ